MYFGSSNSWAALGWLAIIGVVSVILWLGATWGVAVCCFRLAGFWMSVGEAVQYFAERRATNRTKAMEEVGRG